MVYSFKDWSIAYAPTVGMRQVGDIPNLESVQDKEWSVYLHRKRSFNSSDSTGFQGQLTANCGPQDYTLRLENRYRAALARSISGLECNWSSLCIYSASHA